MKNIFKNTFFCFLVVCFLAGGMMSCKNVANENTASGSGDTSNGGLLGTPTGIGQGGTYSTGITISGTTYRKTSEVVVVPAGTTATIIGSDENWSSYYSGTYIIHKGVFIADRNVTLSPYVMSQYEVTTQLYTAVMEDAATDSLLPKSNVSWYDIVAFCNELTKKVYGDSTTECVYSYNGAVYTKDNATSENRPVADITKKGYRLPTEADIKSQVEMLKNG